MSTRDTTLSVRVTDEELAAFDTYRKRHLRTRSDMLRIIVNRAVARDEMQVRALAVAMADRRGSSEVADK